MVEQEHLEGELIKVRLFGQRRHLGRARWMAAVGGGSCRGCGFVRNDHVHDGSCHGHCRCEDRDSKGRLRRR